MEENIKRQETTKNEDMPRVCPKDCKLCTLTQQVYCGAQLSFNSYTIFERIITTMAAMADEVKRMKEDISSLKGEGTSLANPIIGEVREDKREKSVHTTNGERWKE